MTAPVTARPEPVFALVLHDVAPPTWPAWQPLLDWLDARGIGPLTLLVVPHWHGRARLQDAPALVEALEQRRRRGDELVLHGYRHLDQAPACRSPASWVARRVLSAGEAECAALDGASLAALVRRGLQVFAECGWTPRGFVPPAWQMPREGIAVLAGCGLRYSAGRRHLLDVTSARRLPVPALSMSARTAWRRGLSRAWVHAEGRRLAGQAALRLAIHPGDLGHAPLLALWRRLIERLHAERRLLTKAALLECCAEPAVPPVRLAGTAAR